MGLGVLRGLRDKVDRSWPEKAAQIRLVLFSAGGFTDALHVAAAAENVALIGCAELVSS